MARRNINQQILQDPVLAARKRIEACERYGMPVDPRDQEIVAKASKS